MNHFFDTPARDLRSRRAALRLREEEARFTLTLKGPRSAADGDGALSLRPEEETRIEAREATALLAGEVDGLRLLSRRIEGPAPFLAETAQALAGAQLEYLGAFENHRARLGPVALDVDGSALEVLFELDRTEFPGGRTDYEIEVEVAAEHATPALGDVLRELLARAGIEWTTASSKASRFFSVPTPPNAARR